MLGLGLPEILVVGVVLFLVFGPQKIPDFGSSLGITIKGFKEEMNKNTRTKEK